MSLLERVRKALAPNYDVERVLGQGGMGVVYEATDTRLKRKVAVKVLLPELATALAAQRFVREAQLLARFKHPNVVQIHDVDEGEGLSWFVMDLVRGETLKSRLDRGPLTEKETVALARDLLSALATADEQGIVHRDIKPANIFLERGQAFLADFGIARSTTTSEPDGTLTAPAQTTGTLNYMSPEQHAGEKVGAASDQYSLALVLYECCVAPKRWPRFQNPASGEWRAVPTSLVPALKRALGLDPSERWPDARAFSAAIGPGLWKRRLAMAVAAGLVVAAIVYFWPRPHCEAPDSGPYAPGKSVIPGCPLLDSWVQAETLYRGGSWKAADSAYRVVLASDSSCLACEFRLVEMDRWLEHPPEAARVARLRSGLSEFSPAWQLLIPAVLAPAAERAGRLEYMTGHYSDWPLTWYYLGSELFNRGSLFGHARSDALDALEQINSLDSLFVPSWTDRALAHIAAGDTAAAFAALGRLSRLPRAEGLAQAQRLLAELAFAFRFTSHGLELWEQKRKSDSALLAGVPELPAGPRVLPGLGTPEGGILLGRAFESYREKPLQRSGLIAEILGNVALGRLDSAKRAGQRLNALFPSQQLIAFAAMLDAAVVLFDDESTASDAERVEATLIPFKSAIMPPLVRRDAAWLTAVAASRRHDAATAHAQLTMVADEGPPGYRSRFINGVLLAANGQHDSALAITNLLVSDLETWDRTEKSPLFRIAIRMSRARWFEAMGGIENARMEYRWHQHFHLPDYPVDMPVPADGDWAFSTLASWRQARLLDKGPADPVDVELCSSYRLVAERWSGGNPRFRARADTARSRLAVLKCEDSA